MQKYVIFFFWIFFVCIGCKQNKGDGEFDRAETEIKADSELIEISENWKSDSLGCLKKRRPVDIEKLIEQLKLLGKDSIEVVRYLGKPNFRFTVNQDINKMVFLYFLECGKKR